jgi:8-oxo-dGTP pyrophosphatase MutT (NUDIX family)
VSSAANEIRPAATVVLLRDADDGLQVLLVQRASQLVFHGGAWVFPGGRVDPCDAGPDGELGAARRAAVRETREEAGLLLSPDALIGFSHWTTPPGRARRFATWFFLAPVAPDLQVVVDGGETLAHAWFAPLEALARHARGELELPAPTFVSLSALSDCTSVAQALREASARPPPRVVPRLHATAQGELALYEGDVAYAGGPLDQPGPRHRLWFDDLRGHRYERAR